MYMRTQGLVLRETLYKEADKILTVLTPDMGKCTLKATACRRRNSPIMGASGLLVYSEMQVLERGGRLTLKEASPVESFLGLREDITRLALASYFAEVTAYVAEEGMPQADLLSLILNALYALSNLPKDLRLIKGGFEFALLCQSGYQPLLDSCASCGALLPPEGHFDIREGVLYCPSCAQGRGWALSPTCLHTLRYLSQAERKRLFAFSLAEEALQEISVLTEAFLHEQLERDFPTLDYYKRLQLS